MRIPGLATYHTAETESTNSDLLQRVRAEAAAGAATFAPCLLVAEKQTAGRGRHGRAWHAEPGASLTMSLAWPLAAADLSGLSLAVGAALADALEPSAATPSIGAPSSAPRIGLKWPNDLWLMDAAADPAAQRLGRKLGGILIETASCAGTRVAVIGVGINVRALRPADAASGAAWLAEIDAGASVASVLARCAPPLVAALARFDAGGFAAFADRYAARDLLRGRRLRAGAAGELDGVAAGVGAKGELLLRTAAGTVPVTSSEVRLQIVRPDAAHPAPNEAAGAAC